MSAKSLIISAIGALKALKATASSRIAMASARVSGWKLEMNVPGADEVALGLLVVPAVDGVVGALEQQLLAVLHELVRAVRVEAELGARARPSRP